MQIEIKKCDGCDIETNEGKYWGTGAWLCNKCHAEWSEKDKKMREDTSISESVVKKIKKGRNKKRRNLKNIKTKLHEDGFQSRLNVLFE